LGFTIINIDEATFRLVPVNKRIWAPIGSRPLLPFWFSSTKANIFGALIDGKKLHYQWYDKLNASAFINFMKNLIKSLPSGKYIFILDNGPAHKARITKNYLASLGENFKHEFLPAYSPQLNCIETCWKIIRHNVTSANVFKTINNLQRGIESFVDKHFFMLEPSNYLSR
jgi:transposase